MLHDPVPPWQQASSQAIPDSPFILRSILPYSHFWSSPLDPLRLCAEEVTVFEVQLPHTLPGPGSLGQARLPFLGPTVSRLGHPQGTELGLQPGQRGGPVRAW